MADDSYFLPEDAPLEPAANAAQDRLATSEQWAAMTFEPMNIDPQKFSDGWDRTRGAIARTAIALLRFDDRALTRHFQSEPEPLRRALDVYSGLQQEIEYLKTHIEALETASTRLLCVASRCAEQQS